MHTIIRDVKTPKNDFTFFADRLNRLVGGAVLLAGMGGCSKPLSQTPNNHLTCSVLTCTVLACWLGLGLRTLITNPNNQSTFTVLTCAVRTVLHCATGGGGCARAAPLQ